MTKILAIVPARAGSKRLKNKNILPLCGKPLIVHTLEKAVASKMIDKLVVSTDGKEIKKIAKKYCEVIDRPVELAQDDSTTFDVVQHVLDILLKRGEVYDIVVLLEPTSPLRDKYDIDVAISTFLAVSGLLRVDGMMSVGEVALEKPCWMKVFTEESLLKPFCNKKDKAYFPYGVIYLAKVDSLMKHKTFHLDRMMPYFIQRWQNYEIDDECDFLAVESIMKRFMK